SCIKSLKKQTYPKDFFEIIVIDNNSTDKSMDIAKKFNVKIIKEKKKGSYAARNAGIKIAKGSIIAFIDVDCIARDDWIDRAISIFEQDENISLVSGDIEFFSEKKESIWGIYDKNRFLKQEQISNTGS